MSATIGFKQVLGSEEPVIGFKLSLLSLRFGSRIGYKFNYALRFTGFRV